MATTVARLEAVLGADTGQFDKAMNKSEGRIGKLGKAAALGGLAVAGGLAVGLKKSVDAAIESEKAQARLNQAMDGAGISHEKYGKQIEASIQKTSRLAALDDEDLSDSFAKLVRSTGDVTKATEGMNLAADIARSRNISLEAATKTVERGLIGNAAAFGKVGVAIVKSSEHLGAAKLEIDSWRDSSGKLTEAEDQKAKALMDTARTLDKQATAAKAFDEAQRKFAGGAKEYGETAAGAQERFGVAVENLQEKIGAKLLPVLAKLMELALKVIESIERNWPKIMAVIGPIMDDVREKIEAVTEAVQRIWEKHGETIVRVVTVAFNLVKGTIENALKVIQGVIDVVMGVLTGDWQRAWDGIKEIVSGVLNQIRNILSNILPLMAAAALKIGTTIKDSVVDGVTGLAGAVWGLILNIGERIAGGQETINGWGADVGNWLKQAVVDALVGIGNAAWSVINNIGSVIDDVAKTIAGWGGDIARFIKNGVKDGLADLGEVMLDALRSAWNWAKEKASSFLGKINPVGDAFDPNFDPFIVPPTGAMSPATGAVDLMGALEIMRPFAQAAAGYGLAVTSGLRPGAITANGTPSDHGFGKALDVAGSAAGMAGFFRSLIGNPRVKQAFYDPLGSIFGGRQSQYREGGHSDHVHVATYDKGGWLKPGLTLAYNGTGAPERVGGRSGDVHLHFHGDMYGQPPRQFFKQIKEGLQSLDLVQTGGRVLNSTPTLT